MDGRSAFAFLAAEAGVGGGAASCSAVLCIAISCMDYSTGIYSVVYSQSVHVHRISMLATVMCYGVAIVRNALLSFTDDTTVSMVLLHGL